MLSSFQTKLFVAALTSAAIALAVAGTLFATSTARRTDERIEQTLRAEARLAADLLARGTPASTVPELDAEADRIGELIGARVTFIAADGRVVGDSSETLAGVAAMENHASRPEVVEARQSGVGRIRRHSDTLNIDMLYVAVPVAHPAIGFVRVALPLTDIRQQFLTILAATLTALGLALIGAALIGWMFSSRIGRACAPSPTWRSGTAAATSPRPASTTETMSSAWSRVRSTIRCRWSAVSFSSRRAIARAWKPSSPA